MLYYIDEVPRPHIHAIVMQNEAAMLKQLDIYRNPDTLFHVRTWNGECDLTPLALAVEFASFRFAKDFAKVLWARHSARARRRRRRDRPRRRRGARPRARHRCRPGEWARPRRRPACRSRGNGTAASPRLVTWWRAWARRRQWWQPGARPRCLPRNPDATTQGGRSDLPSCSLVCAADRPRRLRLRPGLIFCRPLHFFADHCWSDFIFCRPLLV